MTKLFATKIEYCIEEEDINDNIEFIREKLKRNISVEKAYEYFEKHPSKIYSVFNLPKELPIPKKYAKDDDEITDYISDKTGWLIENYQLVNRECH